MAQPRSDVEPLLRHEAREQLNRHLRSGPGAGYPAMLSVSGPSGIGKTTLLLQLAAKLARATPRVYIDCARYEPHELSKLLEDAKFWLGGRVEPIGRIRFLRLETGLVVREETIDFTGSRDRGEQELKERLRRRMRRPMPDLNRLLWSLPVDLLGQTLPIPIPSPEVTVRLTELIAERFSRRDRALRWYGHRDVGSTAHHLDRLAELNRSPATARERRGQHRLLTEAFLADLRDFYCTGRIKTAWWNNCVMLLDNVDRGPGLELLDNIQEIRDRAVLDQLPAEPLLLVVASRERVAGVTSEPVVLPDLTESEVGKLAEPAAGRLHGQFFRLVHHLTGGYPTAAAALINAAARQPVDVSQGLDNLLWLSQEGETVEDRLLHAMTDSLLRRSDEPSIPARELESLITCAAARSFDDAEFLKADYAPAAQFRDELLPKVTAAQGALSGHRLLKWLLLRRLRARETAPTWDTVFEALRRHAAENQDHIGEWYYALALGDLDTVVRALTERLPGKGAEGEWMSIVKAVCQSPWTVPIDMSPYDKQLELAEPHLNEAPAHQVKVARVIAGCWIADHRCTSPDRADLHRRIADDCSDLALRAVGGGLRQEAESQWRLARRWS